MKNFIKFLTVFTVFLSVSSLFSFGIIDNALDTARDVTVGALNVAETAVEGATDIVDDGVAPRDVIVRDRRVVIEPDVIEPVVIQPNPTNSTVNSLVVEPSID